FITDFEASDWVPTAAAQALMRNNRPLLAYIGGNQGAGTSKDHNFRPGESVHKQVIVINNSRESVACTCSLSVDLPKPVDGGAKLTIGTGDQERIPLQFTLPASLAPGVYRITAQVRFSTGETHYDSFAINVLPTPAVVPAQPKLALFDPKGET